MTRPSLWSLVLRSLSYYFRAHVTVGLGISVATAVIVGALVVGDSVRGSLRNLVIGRLANIECLLNARSFFRPEVLQSLSLSDSESQARIAAGIVLSGTTVEHRSDDLLLRASQVQVLAAGADFWSHVGSDRQNALPKEVKEDEIAINESLARELSASIGDRLTLRLGKPSGIPADNPLGRRDDASISLPRQKVVAILPDHSIGGVSFLSGQEVPRNVFASPETLQDVLDCGTQVNAAFVLTPSPSLRAGDRGQRWCDELNLQLQPKLEDYGLQLERHTRTFPDLDLDIPETTEEMPPETIYDYYQLSAKELILDNATSNAVVEQFGRDDATRLLTYLANSVAKVEPLPSDLSSARSAVAYESRFPNDFGLETESKRSPKTELRPSPVAVDGEPGELTGNLPVDSEDLQLLSREVPYSIIVGVDRLSQLQLEKHTTVPRSSLRIPYCWINSWLAEQLSLAPGEWFQMKYFEPETVEGKKVEKTRRFMVAGIVPLTKPERPFRRSRPAQYALAPERFNDPNLTPSVPGVTDQDSISKWDLPFKLDLQDKILSVDDEYWNDHRLTPKMFIPYRYASSNKLFGSRFGNTTAIRIPAGRYPDEAQVRAEIEEALLSTRSQKGLAFLPIRDAQLAAASGTTPFDMLFLSLSFFVIIASLLLVTLLFKLGIQQRTSQIGILVTQGFTASRIRRLLLAELTWVAAGGALAGMLLGLAYARTMIAGLESWWIGAISSEFLEFSFSWQSLLIGAVVGILASLTTLYASLRRLSGQTPLSMLRNQTSQSEGFSGKLNRISLAIAGFAVFGATSLIFFGLGQSGMARAASFFGCGMLLLASALIALHQMIESGVAMQARPSRWSLLPLAWRAICRNPVRSSLSLGLLAVASFLIASMGVFQVSPTERGYGGFDLLAESSQPIYRNIGSGSVRADMIGDDAQLLLDATIVPLRARLGEDASCNNLFQVAQPTILGVPQRLSELHDFSTDSLRFEWSAANNPENPWKALSPAASGELQNPIPVILDQNTAAWSLKQGASLGSIIQLEFDHQRLYFKTVGLLSNSVLQGKLLIHEDNFQHAFPQISGYSYFLIRSGSQQDPQVVARTLEEGWSDEGLDVTSSQEKLIRLLGVQNTYISAFQSLGALGLLLGTLGLIATQVRSVLERRSELALMQAVGFSQHRIAKMLTLETAILLGVGLLVGVVSAAIALIPYILEVGPQISLANPFLMLLLILAIGFVSAVIAVRTATRQSLVAALRSQ